MEKLLPWVSVFLPQAAENEKNGFRGFLWGNDSRVNFLVMVKDLRVSVDT